METETGASVLAKASEEDDVVATGTMREETRRRT